MHVSTTRYMCQATCVATHIHVFRIEPEGMSCVASSTAYVFYGTATPPVVAAAPAFCSCCPLPVGITFVPRDDSHDADALTTHTHLIESCAIVSVRESPICWLNWFSFP